MFICTQDSHSLASYDVTHSNDVIRLFQPHKILENMRYDTAWNFFKNIIKVKIAKQLNITKQWETLTIEWGVI